jgi:hypothetical protein
MKHPLDERARIRRTTFAARATYWQCELFWIGMNELGLLDKENWKCELFQIGLKELGLAA